MVSLSNLVRAESYFSRFETRGIVSESQNDVMPVERLERMLASAGDSLHSYLEVMEDICTDPIHFWLTTDK
jgi:hypothetical protein